MHRLEDLKRRQVGLRLPKYLIDEIDEIKEEYSLNRSDIIIESIKTYIKLQKEKDLYSSFDKSCKEVKEAIDGKKECSTLDDMIDEL